MTSTQYSPEDLRELLPFFVNGTLPKAEAAAVTDALAQDPALTAEVAQLQTIGAAFKAEPQPQSPGEFGLARLMRDLDAETRTAPDAAATQPVHSVLRARLMGQSVLGGTLRLATAAAIGAVAVFLTLQPEAPVATQASSVSIAAMDGASISVAFMPGANVADVAAFLLDNNLVIVDGPSALGLFQVAPFDMRNADVEAAIAALQAAPELIESVELP